MDSPFGASWSRFSYVRETAAMALGFRQWRLKQSEVIEEQADDPEHPGQKITVYFYDGIVRDMALVLWLCSQDDTTVKQAPPPAR